MDAEHKRPLAAFLVVSAATVLLLGQSVLEQVHPTADRRPTAARVAGEITSSPSATGRAVDPITARPRYWPAKQIGPAPLILARGSGLEVSTGAVRDPNGKPPTRHEGAKSRPKKHRPSSGPTG